MKIIGKTENGFILEASKDEIANVLDHYNAGWSGPKVCIGQELDLASIYHKAKCLGGAKGILERVRKNLMDLAEEVRPVEILIQAAEGGGHESR